MPKLSTSLGGGEGLETEMPYGRMSSMVISTFLSTRIPSSTVSDFVSKPVTLRREYVRKSPVVRVIPRENGKSGCRDDRERSLEERSYAESTN